MKDSMLCKELRGKKEKKPEQKALSGIYFPSSFFFLVSLSFLFQPLFTPLQLSGGALYFEHTASRAGEMRIRGYREGYKKREAHRIILLPERHEYREEERKRTRSEMWEERMLHDE